MSKKLVWFKIEEKIPENAVYIKSETCIIGYREIWHPMYSDEEPIYEEKHLYEVIEYMNFCPYCGESID